jgi:hypothetical protein
MGDLARTTMLAWPYPGRHGLPCRVLEELQSHDALPAGDDPIAEDYLGGAGAVVLGGDQRSGLILAVVDEHARHGIAAYRSTIQALSAAGLHVFAGNDAAASFGGCWEYHPPRGNGARPQRRRRAGDVLVVSAFDLLEAGERTVADVPDEVLAATTRPLVGYPNAVPAVVLGAAF